MSDLTYLYGAYTIVWLGLFFYIIKLHIAQRRLKNEIKMLREIINGKKSKKNL
ncbi:MAG: CcmD family protein [Thermoplasmatales archaeon]|nr:MAG: CcmD family protein [Thermoplasmatales archaeon]